MNQIQPFIAPPREFSLGGLLYTAPGKIGAGIQADVAQLQLAEYAKTEEYQQMVDIDEIRKTVKTTEEIQAKVKALEKEMIAGFTIWSTKNMKIITLVTLEVLLTPCSQGYPAMKDVYDQLATSKEVEAVTNFFKGKSNDSKEESDSSLSNSESQTTAEPSIRNTSSQKRKDKGQKK